MASENLQVDIKRDFNNAICLTGLIPFAVFIYLLVGNIASMNILTGQVGYVLLITMALILLGILTGRRMLWMVIERIVSLQNELVEKNRLAAVTETALALSHEVNNPLLVMRGNLQLLEEDGNLPDMVKEKFDTIKGNCERIRTVTDKLSSLSKPATTTIYGKSKMIDLEHST